MVVNDEKWLTRKKLSVAPSGVPVTVGARLPNGFSRSSSSYSSVDVAEVTRRSKSVVEKPLLPEALPSIIAKTRAGRVGVPSEKKSASPEGLMRPVSGQDSALGVVGASLGSVSGKHCETSTL